jgi:hypothetical protein
MKKLSAIEMQETQGGFLVALFLGLLVGVFIGVIVWEANPPTV